MMQMLNWKRKSSITFVIYVLTNVRLFTIDTGERKNINKCFVINDIEKLN